MNYSQAVIDKVKETIERVDADLNRQKFWQMDGDFRTAINKLTAEISRSVGPALGADAQTVNQSIQELVSHIGWYGPLQEQLGREDITVIMINSPAKPFLFEKDGKLFKAGYAISAEWMEFTVKSLRRRRGLDGELPPRYTGALSTPPMRFTWVSQIFGVNGASLYLRKFRRYPFTMRDQMKRGTITWEVAQFLDAIVKARVNILVSGGSGAGKTTILTTMGLSIPETERVVAVEDEHEIHLTEVLPNFVAYELNPEEPRTTMSDLLRHVGLKVAPDRVLVGEVRGKEAFDLLQAMNTGIDGSMATIHANAPADALKKWADYVAMSDTPMPPEVIYSRIADVHPIVVQISRLPNGQRMITGIAECLSAAKTTFETANLFEIGEERGPNGERLPKIVRTRTPFSPYLADRFAAAGIVLHKTYEEFVKAQQQKR